MSVDTWASLTMDMITLIVISVLSWKLANKPTEVRLLKNQPAEKMRQTEGQNGNTLPPKWHKAARWLVLVAVIEIFLGVLDLIELFTATGPFYKRHLFQAVNGTYAIIVGLLLLALSIITMRASRRAETETVAE